MNNKKFTFFILLLISTPVIAMDIDTHYQMLDMQIEKLTAERDSKKALLDECEEMYKGYAGYVEADETCIYNR